MKNILLFIMAGFIMLFIGWMIRDKFPPPPIEVIKVQPAVDTLTVIVGDNKWQLYGRIVCVGDKSVAK